MVSFPGSIAFDEFGKPFIILRDQEQQKRLTGNDAIKVSLTYRIWEKKWAKTIVFLWMNHANATDNFWAKILWKV